MTYTVAGARVIIDHTQVDDSLRGEGVGAKLVQAAVDWARAENARLMPLCPYAKSVFDKTPEEKVGALFWRMHRCARIIFSLKFHMGQWSPQEAIDFLVDRVGHERENATAEVRRSFDPSAGYGPLYQAAYLLGGLQLRGLRKELVDTKIMTNMQFHDEIMRQGAMPNALLRLAVNKRIPLTRDMDINWKFYGPM